MEREQFERLYYKGRQSANKKEKVVLETYVAVFVPNIQNRALNWKGRQPAIRETCMRLVQQSVWKSSKLIASEIIAKVDKQHFNRLVFDLCSRLCARLCAKAVMLYSKVQK